jgi:hypothetical protein
VVVVQGVLVRPVQQELQTLVAEVAEVVTPHHQVS